jgi:hypothetical protein
MSFIAKWLFGKPKAVAGLRPHRDVELALAFDPAYDRVLAAVDATLGANVAVDDRKAGFIEAAFGLVNSERIRCRIESIDATHTAVHVEAYFPAGAAVRERSQAVDALADALAR